ncbi:MAG: hypothetical protein LBJ73_01870 [Rickettsiales bacterium]|jgi:hypothetical protein|nr:hypothetical protein [Rickettsiales bacterium]
MRINSSLLPNKNPGFFWLSAVDVIALCCPASADIASTSYIKNAIQSNWGVNLTSGDGIASSSYLFAMIDAANLALNGRATTYGQGVTGSNIISKSKVDIELEKIKYCVPGTYLPPDENDCSDCGIGYYCTGGIHRAPCTGGVIACSGMNHDADEFVSDNLMNRVLTMDEVNTYVPATDIAQWRQLSCCATQYSESYDIGIGNNLQLVNDYKGCATNTIGPGTYLFTVRTGTFCTGRTDIFNGQANSASNFYIAVFDQPSSYKTFHANNVFWNFVDVGNATFTTWDFHVPTVSYCTSVNQTNVSNLASVPREICVFELK